MSCFNCKERKVGCHADCEDYQEEKRKHDELRERIWKEKDTDNVITGRLINRAEKLKKKKGEKR